MLDAAPVTAAVTVIGAGPTGIETAAELAEAGRTVTLVCGGVLGPYLHPRGRRAVARRLAALGVTVLDGPGATVTAVTRDAVTLGDGRELPSVVTIWTAGFGVPDLAARSGLRTDALGRLLTDETLTSVDDARHVYAAIRRARPGGLGRSDAQDVASEPDVTLLDAMRLAADRDGIAREYATGFAATFELGAPTLARARARLLTRRIPRWPIQGEHLARRGFPPVFPLEGDKWSPCHQSAHCLYAGAGPATGPGHPASRLHVMKWNP